MSGAVTVVDDQGRRLALAPASRCRRRRASAGHRASLGHDAGMGPQHRQAGYSGGRLPHLAHQLALSGCNAYRLPLTPTRPRRRRSVLRGP
ncbi:MAG: hypothetical protein WKG07_40630 [Hymenobacter sp.]